MACELTVSSIAGSIPARENSAGTQGVPVCAPLLLSLVRSIFIACVACSWWCAVPNDAGAYGTFLSNNGIIPGRYRHAAFVTSTTEIWSALKPLRSLRAAAAAVSLADSCVSIVVRAGCLAVSLAAATSPTTCGSSIYSPTAWAGESLLWAVVACCANERAVSIVMQGERQQCVRCSSRCQLSCDLWHICTCSLSGLLVLCPRLNPGCVPGDRFRPTPALRRCVHLNPRHW